MGTVAALANALVVEAGGGKHRLMVTLRASRESMHAARRGADDREYSDDDDVSWKVRRAAVNTLRSLILTRPDLVPYFYSRVAPTLVARFREREDNVRLDILITFITLLEHTNAAGRVAGSDTASSRAAAAASAQAVGTDR